MMEKRKKVPSARAREAARRRAGLPRLTWSLVEVAAALGTTTGALRRRCERIAEPTESGGRVAQLELGIVASKTSLRGRWRFVVPAELVARTRTEPS